LHIFPHSQQRSQYCWKRDQCGDVEAFCGSEGIDDGGKNGRRGEGRKPAKAMMMARDAIVTKAGDEATPWMTTAA
jgi:hypothetical protein